MTRRQAFVASFVRLCPVYSIAANSPLLRLWRKVNGWPEYWPH